MSGDRGRWTAEQVLALAPDATSRASAGRVATAGMWSAAGTGDAAVWGRCVGRRKRPYRTVVDLTEVDGSSYHCDCLSMKVPCKHMLGLLLLWAGRDPVVNETGRPPSWGRRWLSERRAGAAPNGGVGGDTARPPADPAAALRRAQRRAAAVAAGASELEQRLEDLLRSGFATDSASLQAEWEQTAARMVDAKAPGLAARARELASAAASGSGPGRLLAECALLHLLARGCLATDTLPEPLAATVRARAGIRVRNAAVLADPDARVRDEWLVLALRDTVEGRLTIRRAWLYGRSTGRHALLLAFGAAGASPQLPAFTPGTALDAELAFHPGAPALRAVLAECHGLHTAGFTPDFVHGPPDGGGGETEGAGGVGAALATYGEALRDDPWLDTWPVTLRAVVPTPPTAGADGWHLADARRDEALPVPSATPAARLWRLAAVSGGRPVTVFGECGHLGFVPHSVWAGPAEPVVQL